MDAVVAYCGNCDNLEALLPAVSRYGDSLSSVQCGMSTFVYRIAEKHVSVSVEPEQYTAVGLTLLQAMEVRILLLLLLLI